MPFFHLVDSLRTPTTRWPPAAARQTMLFVGAMRFTILAGLCARGYRFAPRESLVVFSLLGVLAITFLMFLGVAATARLILGK